MSQESKAAWIKRQRWLKMSVQDKRDLIDQLGVKGAAHFFGKSYTFLKRWIAQQ